MPSNDSYSRNASANSNSDPGGVGVTAPAPATTTTTKQQPKPKKSEKMDELVPPDELRHVRTAHGVDTGTNYRCVVHRLNSEKENADLPISVCLVGRKRRVITPGTEVVLIGYLIDILRNAVQEDDIEVPSSSAIYEQADPLKAAESAFPGFRAKLNPEDGSIRLIRSTPMYSVEVRGKAHGGDSDASDD